MKHLTYSNTSLYVGDEVAEVLLNYAAMLASNNQADTVELQVAETGGDEVLATLLLDGGTLLMTETTASAAPEPDNAKAIAYMKKRMTALKPPKPVADAGLPDFDEMQL